MRIWIAEASRSTPLAPRHVWRVFEHGRELAMGICAGTRRQAEIEAEAAVAKIEAERTRRDLAFERRIYASDPDLFAEWEALFHE